MKKKYIGIIIILLFVSTFMIGCDNVKKVSNTDKITQMFKDDEYEVIIKNVKCSIIKPTAGVLKVDSELNEICKVTGDSADKLEVNVDKKKKLIKISATNNIPEDSIKIEIGAKVNEISIYDSRLTLDCNFADVKKLTADIEGKFSGKINVDDIDTLDLELDGAGNVDLKGNCTDSQIYIQGAMIVHGFDLITKNTNVTIEGVGSCEVYASEKLDARLDGVGKIVYDGNPKDLDKESNGLGSIESR